MAFKLKLPAFSFGKGQKKSAAPVGEETLAAPTRVMEVPVVKPAKEKKPKEPAAALTDFLGQYPVVKQLQILGSVLLVVMLFIAGLVYHDNRESTYGTVYVAAAGEMRMLSQRLAKDAAQALQGTPVAFEHLKTSRESFARLLERLSQGGEITEVAVPPSPDGVQPQLQALMSEWEKTDKNATRLLEMEKNLVNLGKDVAIIASKNPQLLELSEQVAALKLQSGGGAREIAAANQMVMLTQRIAKNASALLVGDAIDPEVAFLLGKDTNSFRDLLNGLIKGNETLKAASDGDTRTKLGELEGAFKEYQDAVSGILGNMQRLVLAKQSGSAIFKDSDELLAATDKLADAYQAELAERALYIVILVVMVLVALGALVLMAKIYLEDSRRRAEEAERLRLESEQLNRQNQDAILRLMNELGDLADGDLTVTATVSEDITGAIADSINYTIEELRVLVGRINDAANRVTLATEMARKTSEELLAAAERQSKEIEEAGRSVLTMASSMNQVSSEATQSAQVARQSLSAAEKGAQAVQDSIKGMNEIREQIQETAKRIKRLGESSQEIGEIVELISDITEQTNVLALNAAIQAASAGEAGRGFSVVAEEVQRLAERSADATRQIAALVKAIQTDTQDAVAAMARSTQGVVEGAKLSDNAGTALSEIDRVSRRLAELIEQISDAASREAESANEVAGNIQHIFAVTEQTGEGTRSTAQQVRELSAMAEELRQSVSRFKIA